MNKVLKVISAGLLSAVVAVSAAASVSAAGVSADEQKIVDALNGTVSLNGNATKIPARYVNQAENYFNTVEITESEANTIIEKIDAVKKYLESTGVSKWSELTSAQIDQIVALSNDASKVIGVTLTYDKITKAVTATKDGKTISDVVVPGGSGSNAGNDVIKTTGFAVADATVIAGLGILLVTAAGVYLLKTSKKDENC
ncbi:MAG: hypothetical protein IJ861_01365 [Clostridia bacterium]|nr:hypothetical protein [Clostridia bacterium]